MKDMKVLIIEDDENISRLLADIARKSGYFPKQAYSGTEGLIYLENEKWDMVLLDLMLAGMTGEEILEKIRATTNIPVIIISAKLETETKIQTLRAGADDYITKPFDIDEVSARMEVCVRRYNQLAVQESKELQFKDITLDMEGKKVFIKGQPLKLTAIEYEILFLLMSTPKKIFTKANLFESIWQDEFFGDDNTVNVHMSRLRSKLNKANSEIEYIETIWGMGYRLKS